MKRLTQASPTARSLVSIAGLVAVGALLAAARPGDEYTMLLHLNGQEKRWTMWDGGASGMFGSPACMSVQFDGGFPAAGNNVVELLPTTPINLCYVNINSVPPWDGGCGLNAGDINQGVMLQSGVPKFVVLANATTHLCQASDAGAGATTPVFSMQ